MQRLRFRSVLAGAGLMAWALVAPLAGQQPAAAARAPRASAAAARPAPGSLHAGIQVHGRWTIVVHNKDGSVASRHVIENAVVTDGIDLLPAILGGEVTPGGWEIMLADNMDLDSSGAGPCGNSGADSILDPSEPLYKQITPIGPCVIVNPNAVYYNGYGFSLGCPSGSGNCNANLKVSLVSNGTYADGNGNPHPLVALQLTGWVPVTQNGTIYTVATGVVACTSTTPGGSESQSAGFPTTNLSGSSTATPSTCAQGTSSNVLFDSVSYPLWYFTATDLASPGIKVLAQQSVEVTVLISFS
jgi:hypothetical protein